MVQLILVRHGESIWNEKNLFTGWTDVPLSKKGIKEAENAGLLLKGFKIDICYTSVLLRAIETAKIILKTANLSIPMIENWHLNERHYGALQGFNKEQITQKYGEQQAYLWRRTYDTRPPLLEKKDERNPAFESKYKNLPSSEIPLGESLKDTISRLLPYYKQEIEPQLKQGKNVLIVAHGNSLRALKMFLQSISEIDITNINIPTGIPFIYELNQNLKIKQIICLEKK